MQRIALLIGIVLMAASSAPSHASDTDVDVGDAGDVLPDTDAAPDAEPDRDAEPGRDAEPDADIAPDVDAGTGTDTPLDADIDTGTDAGADLDTAGDADTAPDLGTDADLDAAGDIDTAPDVGSDVATDVDATPAPRTHKLTVQVRVHSRNSPDVTATATLDGPEQLDFEIDVPGEIDVELLEGTFALTLEAAGFDTIETSVAVWSDSATHLELYPEAQVTLSGYVALGSGRLSDADIVVSGGRLTVPIATQSGDDGVYAVENLPSGFYDIRVSFDGGWAMERSGVELLTDTELNFSLPLPGEERDVTTTRTLCASSPGTTGALWGILLALLAARRRR